MGWWFWLKSLIQEILILSENQNKIFLKLSSTWRGRVLRVFRWGLWVTQGRRTRLLRRLGVSRRSLRQCGVCPGYWGHAACQRARLGSSNTRQGGVFRRWGTSSGQTGAALGIAGGRMLWDWLVPSHHIFKVISIFLFIVF